MNVVGDKTAPQCSHCGHRADLPRMECDCARCRRFEVPKDASGRAIAAGTRVTFDEPHGAYTSGTVRDFTRGILDPVAVVEYAEGRTFDTLCRRLTLATAGYEHGTC
jgi:hypothetical protein